MMTSQRVSWERRASEGSPIERISFEVQRYSWLSYRCNPTPEMRGRRFRVWVQSKGGDDRISPAGSFSKWGMNIEFPRYLGGG